MECRGPRDSGAAWPRCAANDAEEYGPSVCAVLAESELADRVVHSALNTLERTSSQTSGWTLGRRRRSLEMLSRGTNAAP